MGNFYDVQVALHSTSGLAKDDVVNTSRWYWNSSGNPTNTDWANLIGDLHTFYAACFASGPYLGATMTGTGSFKAYDSQATPPRVPVHTASSLGTTISVGSSSLPREVALCVSWKGDYTSGVPHARQRGRWYLGCWSSGMVQNDGTVASAIVTQVANAAAALLTSASAHNFDLYIHSGLTPPNTQVTGGWVDNAFDTQRRRQQPATSRTTF